MQGPLAYCPGGLQMLLVGGNREEMGCVLQKLSSYHYHGAANERWWAGILLPQQWCGFSGTLSTGSWGVQIMMLLVEGEQGGEEMQELGLTY